MLNLVNLKITRIPWIRKNKELTCGELFINKIHFEMLATLRPFFPQPLFEEYSLFCR